MSDGIAASASVTSESETDYRCLLSTHAGTNPAAVTAFETWSRLVVLLIRLCLKTQF